MRTSLLVLSSAAVISSAGCGGTDSPSFGSTGGAGGVGGRDAVTSGDVTSGAATSAAATTGTGTTSCGPGEKACGSVCVSVDSPTTGCGAKSCTPCDTDNAVAVCADQVCAVDKCIGSWRDCDHAQGNGCESDSAIDSNNCGGCDVKCMAPHAGIGGCEDSKCLIGPCVTDYADCDGSILNGCEVATSTSKAHCGACGNACNAVETCDDGTCVSCGRGFNYGSAAAVVIPTSLMHAFKYVPSHNEHLTQLCIKGGESNNSYKIAILSDNNGPSKVLSISTAFYSASLPTKVLCTSTVGAGISADLAAGSTYWIATNAYSPLVDPNGEQLEVYGSSQSVLDSSTVWYPWSKTAGFIAKAVAACN